MAQHTETPSIHVPRPNRDLVRWDSVAFYGSPANPDRLETLRTFKSLDAAIRDCARRNAKLFPEPRASL